MSIAVEPLEILGRWFEERPLIALEVHPHEVAEHRQRLEPAGVDQLEHDVGVAVGLRVDRCVGVQRMGPVARWIAAGEAAQAVR